MNDLGAIATDIVTYSFPDDTGRFSVSYVSGWLESRIGLFNALTHMLFELDATGAFVPSLFPVEKDILKGLYEIEYYHKAAREALRGIIWGGTSALSDSITMVKEGDSIVQKVSKHQISKTFSDFAGQAQLNLNNLIWEYNHQKATPIQVAGEDGNA